MKINVALAHMKAAFGYANLSYCVRKQVGCVIVKDDTIISIGYNGTLSGEPNMCEGQDGFTLPTVIHAEANAMDKLARLNGGGEGSSVFVTMAPCFACAVRLANMNIGELFYCEQYNSQDGISLLARRGIPIHQLTQEEINRP